MANKRERKPQEPIETIFEEQPEVIREVQPEATEYTGSSDTDVFSSIIDMPKQVERVTETVEKPTGSVDEYIRKQVLTSMYGTETPSEYDKISLALKRLL